MWTQQQIAKILYVIESSDTIVDDIVVFGKSLGHAVGWSPEHGIVIDNTRNGLFVSVRDLLEVEMKEGIGFEEARCLASDLLPDFIAFSFGRTTY